MQIVSETNSVESQFVENPVFSLTDVKAKNESANLNTPSNERSNAKIIALQNDRRLPSDKMSAGQTGRN